MFQGTLCFGGAYLHGVLLLALLRNLHELALGITELLRQSITLRQSRCQVAAVIACVELTLL